MGLEGHTCAVNCLVFNSVGSLLASGSGEEIKLWDVVRGTSVATLNSGRGDRTTFADVAVGKIRPAFGACCLAFSPDGKILASGGMDNNVILWNVANPKMLATLHGHTDTVYSVAFSPDGRTLASGSDDKTIRIWDLASGGTVATLSGHTAGVLSVAYTQDGKLLASGSCDRTVKLWKVGNVPWQGRQEENKREQKKATPTKSGGRTKGNKGDILLFSCGR
jgi:WD40 repeat protein